MVLWKQLAHLYNLYKDWYENDPLHDMLAASAASTRRTKCIPALRLYYNWYSTIHEIVIRVDQQQESLFFALCNSYRVSNVHASFARSGRDKVQKIMKSKIRNCSTTHEIREIKRTVQRSIKFKKSTYVKLTKNPWNLRPPNFSQNTF